MVINMIEGWYGGFSQPRPRINGYNMIEGWYGGFSQPRPRINGY